MSCIYMSSAACNGVSITLFNNLPPHLLSKVCVFTVQCIKRRKQLFVQIFFECFQLFLRYHLSSHYISASSIWVIDVNDPVPIECTTLWFLCILYYRVLICNKQISTFSAAIMPLFYESLTFSRDKFHLVSASLEHFLDWTHFLFTCSNVNFVQYALSFIFYHTYLTTSHNLGTYLPSNMAKGSNLILNFNTTALVW